MIEPEIEVTLNGVSHKLSSLSDEARAQVTNLQFVDNEIARLNAKLAVYATARKGYQDALQQLLPRTAQ